MEKHKPIEIMHRYFGVGSDGKCCGTCCNLVEIQTGNKKVRKCRAYGVTCSARSDWAKKWIACGLYGKEVQQESVSDTAKQMFSRIGIGNFAIDRQMVMEE